MHQTRANVNTRIPLTRKGTRYVARADNHPDTSVPVVIAIRDMLKLAKTSKEVELLIKEKLISVNGRTVRDIHESVCIFSILKADKMYQLSILPTGRFYFEEVKGKERVAKVVGKTILNDKKTQLNLHDGTNVLTKDKVNVGDSVSLDFDNKVTKIIPLEKGKHFFIFGGKHVGHKGTVDSVDETYVHSKIGKHEALINKKQVIVL